jgi:hypothetical protein
MEKKEKYNKEDRTGEERDEKESRNRDEYEEKEKRYVIARKSINHRS